MKHPTIVLASFAACVFATATSRAGFVQPSFDPANFTPGAPIDNKFFPIIPGTTFRAEGDVTDPEDNSSGHEVDIDFVTSMTRNIGGVQARIVHSTVSLDGEQIEDTNDYYAQDKSGNVWYMGEDTKAFERDDEGNIVSTDTSGSWRTGVHGALPGFIMPANPTVGFQYIQEHAPQDGAEDQAEVVSLNESVTVPLGSFTNVLKTEETTPLEPGDVENKFYAAGVGPILVWENVENGVPLNRIATVSITRCSATRCHRRLCRGSHRCSR